MLLQPKRRTLRELHMIVHPRARGFPWNVRARAGLGLEPVVVSMATHGAMLHEKVTGIVANFVMDGSCEGAGLLVDLMIIWGLIEGFVFFVG